MTWLRRLGLAGLTCLAAVAAAAPCQTLEVRAWFGDPSQNTPLCTAPDSVILAPDIAPDGSGGAIIAWETMRSGDYWNPDIYVQKVDSSGLVQWIADGVAICTASEGRTYPQIVSDGLGGAIVTWQDDRDGDQDIYAQRVTATGLVQWTQDGVAICAAAGEQFEPQIVSDGSGGAIITWSQWGTKNGEDLDVYAQRVDSSGALQWSADGVAVSTAAICQWQPEIIPDGSGGAIIAWQDDRREFGRWDIYAQRLDSGGAIQWTANGMAIATAEETAETLGFPTIVSDGAGGAIIAWPVWRNSNYDLCAQRVDCSGALQWGAGGLAVCTKPSQQYDLEIVSDERGGAIIAWQDWESGVNYGDLYAQRVDSSGALQWPADGVDVSTAPKVQGFPQIVSDGRGGAIIAWQVGDLFGSVNREDVYAQRVDSSGAVRWTAGGVAICTVPGSQIGQCIASDGKGGAILCWVDAREGSWGHPGMYAERVDSAGNLPDTAHPTVTLGSTAGSVTATPCIPVTATFSEPVTGFTIDDIAVGNGIACDFAAGSARIYTFDITPVEQGQVTVDIAAGAARDAAGNGNTAAVQYRITYARPWPTITSFTAIPGDHADTVVVTGTNFTGACGVMFGDRSAISFSVDSDSQITAMAEHGVSGRILIAAPQGTAISDDVYSGHVPSPVEPDQSRAVPRVWVWPVAAIVAFLGIAAASSFAVWLRGRMAIRPDTGHH